MHDEHYHSIKCELQLDNSMYVSEGCMTEKMGLPEHVTWRRYPGRRQGPSVVQYSAKR